MQKKKNQFSVFKNNYQTEPQSKNFFNVMKNGFMFSEIVPAYLRVCLAIIFAFKVLEG